MINAFYNRVSDFGGHMKTVGIIAEYNPFHNGHAYQIEQIRKKTGADYVIIAMSGDFVQRGAPAVFDKYARTQMALSHGADLVIELPVLWATSSAESFAMAGVTLFDKMGCIDMLCFGAENDDLTALSSLAAITADEPDAYRAALSAHLKEGMNFPSARTAALQEYCNEAKNAYVSAEDISDLMHTPNNILAIEYLKALRRRSCHIQPQVLLRKGNAYHDKTIASSYASATAIRSALYDKDAASVTCSMPKDAYRIMQEYLSSYPPIFMDDTTERLSYLLLTTDADALSSYEDVTEDIARKLLRNRSQFTSSDAFCKACTSKDITYTRMSRILIHLLLSLKKEDYAHAKACDYIPYLRILGFKKDATPLLRQMKQSATVPIVTKLADAKNILSEDAYRILSKDIFAADLYESMISTKKETPGRSEFTREVIRVD